MNRRDFARAGTGLALAGLAAPLWAQGAPAEGRDFKRVEPPVAVPAGGKVDVVEFFGYWCPHCNAFEPALDAWVKKLPAHVSFRRVPVLFNAAQETTQKLYFALEALGQVEALHRKVFAALHVQHRRLDKEADVLAWAQEAGADGAKIVDAMKSFGVATKSRQARQLAESFRIDGVPTLGIHGRWLTSPSIAGSQERALAVADALIAQARKA